MRQRILNIGSMPVLAVAVVLAHLLLSSWAQADELVEPFVGHYTGSAEMVASDGTRQPRDMSVTIDETKDGFTVQWTSVTYKQSGKKKEKSYSIDKVFTRASTRSHVRFFAE